MKRSTNPHAWYLSDLEKVPGNGLKVFSTFACGGGSSMGYKRAGYEMVGANDIDPQMRRHYETNLRPKTFIEGPVLDLATMDLPDEMFNLDVLDGSPPCSTFSMAGSREKAWGREKHFREGQAVQVLDDLFFDFLRVAARLRPKVVIAENVKGMVAGNARGYVKAVFDLLRSMGYRPQIFLINAAYCGVPQRRERVFICAVRDDVSSRKLSVQTSGTTITFAEAVEDIPEADHESYLRSDSKSLTYWKATAEGRNFTAMNETIQGKSGWHGCFKMARNMIPPTIVSSSHFYHPTEPRHLTAPELCRIGSFPDDYTFYGQQMAQYLIGMSVPPKMMQTVAEAVRDQWLI
jgi:DNA (cytosine-5)-methyltransferase 1